MLVQRVRLIRSLVPVSIAAVLGGGGCTRQSSTAPPGLDNGVATRQAPDQSIPSRSSSSNVEIADLYHLRSAGDPQISPDGKKVVFAVQCSDRVGPPYSRIWIADLASGTSKPWGDGDGQEGSAPRWSPDGTRLAFQGRTGEGKSGIVIANADGSGLEPLVDVTGSNHPLPQLGQRFAWSPNGTSIAFVSAMPGPEPPIEADPIVITRYWYRPASGHPDRFTDNRRLHLFIADLPTKQVRQLTEGTHDEHSIDWSPDGTRLVFLSNHEPDPDFRFNYDIFTIDVASRVVKRITETQSNEYAPVWSPDGTTIGYLGLERPITSSETNMEDTHVWTLDVATGSRHEVGVSIDNRQGRPLWSPDGQSLYFTVQARGSVGLYRLPATGGLAQRVGPPLDMRGSVSTFAVGKDGLVVAAISDPARPAELYAHGPSESGTFAMLTTLNKDVLEKKTLANVEALTFSSFDGREVEAFLTKPASLNLAPSRRYPMIVMIHGGPHGQQGPAFVHKAQTYAARGWAALMVNYRGSTGYGQAFSNAIARDQKGGEAKDVLAAVDVALAKYPWIDRDRLGVEGGSYGGQLSNWIITQTTRFKAAIPWASISNLVSHNYMSVYHDYLEQEYNGKPHTGGIMDMLWERSPIRFVHRVTTPVMLSHGDNDLLVNPAEIEQYFTALKDAGVEVMMLRYPREGHGMRETQHVADFLERSIAWYEKHFQSAAQRTN
ncbi:MAG: S9 family peptidase [Vicinamibacterales bacterium]